jgi:hypothetical protein
VSDPKRLLESSPVPLTRKLLQAGIPDAPDPRSLPRLLAAAGSLATFGASSAAAGSAFTAHGLASGLGAIPLLVRAVGGWSWCSW